MIKIEERVTALAKHLGVESNDIDHEYGEEFSCRSEPGIYLVVTGEEADELWDQALESYIDDCILPELPEIARNYFDTDKWKRDARFDGRGHSLSHYDGEEHEVKVDGVYFYIYRTN